MAHVGPLGKNLNFFVSLGIAEILGFSELSVRLKLFCSKPFHNTLNYASTANNEEVTKFYDLGDKTCETDFKTMNITPFYDRMIPLGHRTFGFVKRTHT